MTAVSQQEEILRHLFAVRRSMEEDLERWRDEASGAFCEQYIRTREKQLEWIEMLCSQVSRMNQVNR